jgi:hypothetical protein
MGQYGGLSGRRTFVISNRKGHEMRRTLLPKLAVASATAALAFGAVACEVDDDGTSPGQEDDLFDDDFDDGLGDDGMDDDGMGDG